MDETRDTAAELQQIQENAAQLQHDPGEWYRQVNYEDSKIFIRTNLNSAARSFIAIGYYLKHIRDGELFREDGYESIWEFAKAEYGISKSTASRYMSMNDRFSQGGDSPLIDSQYKDFDKSKLQEMLSLTDEQLEQVTPEMKVQEIRSMRPQREIPYFEIEGQLDLATDFPEVVPEPAEQVRPETRTFMMNVADLVGDDVELEKIDGVVATVATESAEKPEMDHEVRRRYCNAAARKLIEAKYDWMREDYKNRVLMVDESEKQLKALLFKSGSLTWYFSDPYGIGMTRVNLFPDYIQFFNEDCGGWVGNCSWFYLCAAIQGMWNEVVLEKAAAGAVAISQQNGNVEESTKLDEKAEMNTARLEIQSGTQRSSILCADMINDVPLSDLNLLKEMLEQEVSIWQETKVIFEENSEFYRKVRIRAAALVCLLEKMDGANEPDEPE